MTFGTTRLALLIGLCGLLAASLPAHAQVQQQDVPRDLFTQQLRQQGNSVTFCYNPDGMMAAFEQDLARAISDVLLIESRLFALEASVLPQPPLDHRLPLQVAQIFVALAQDCDAIMGFSLSPSNPAFVLVTKPYMETPTVMVTIDPELAGLDGIGKEGVVATRGLSLADNALINYVAAHPDARWTRSSYRTNRDLIEAALGGQVDIALVWEPALYVATQGDPSLFGLRVLPELPFPVRPLQTGIGTRAENTYLNQLLGDAITELQADGTIRSLMEQHLLKPPGSD
ncbi:MAG: transporter substrate-binding domain-containing protein [Devosia sp.]|nr:transporter substrate-binding domain-containing protein [Devosia sp.]